MPHATRTQLPELGAGVNLEKVIKQLEFQSSKKLQDLSISTHALGILAQREAVAVRIITVVSLIYLPCSVVSVSLPYPVPSQNHFFGP